nr:cytochrome c biogenesis protein CcdC [Marininema halotolerans]
MMGPTIPLKLHWLVTLGTLIIALSFIFIRLRASKRPTDAKKILIPPLGMSTGFFMFVYPPCHIPISWAMIAFSLGALFFATPLIRTSRFEVIDGDVYLKRSKAFIWILLALFAIRMLAHEYIQSFITIPQTAGIFFCLAFGMLLPWRVAMYLQYQRLLQQKATLDKV